jgi:hypothetical protein
MKLFLTALSACLFFAMPAEARKLVAVAPECNITMPCEGVGRGDVSRTVERRVGRKIVRTADTVYRAAIARPLAFVGGRLNCARAVNAHLAASGRAGTGSAAARSFASWGSPDGRLRRGHNSACRRRTPTGVQLRPGKRYRRFERSCGRRGAQQYGTRPPCRRPHTAS